jgi:hypothetical protein
VISALVAVLWVLALASGQSQAASAMAAETSVPDNTRPDDTALVKRQPLIDQNVVFLSCASGASLGAVITGLPPVIGWIPYAGWPTQLGALTLRMGLGCYYGLMIGVAASGTYSVARAVDETWHSLF